MQYKIHGQVGIEPTKEDLQIKSIWKDVSELPKEGCALIVEMET